VRRLKEVGLYERSLVVVTSDHGVSFRPGNPRRRENSRTIADIAYSLFLVKRPGQRRGVVDDTRVETVDVLPTIADALGFRMPWRVEGRSAFEGRSRDRARVGRITTDRGKLERLRRQALERQFRLFGWGDERPGLYGLGPHPELIGHKLSKLASVRNAAARAVIAPVIARALRDVAENDRLLPSPIAGRVEGDDATPGRGLAVAVNGRVVAVSRTFAQSGGVGFSVLVPETSFRIGANEAEIFWIVDEAGGPALERLGG
jgi:Sulfatase